MTYDDPAQNDFPGLRVGLDLGFRNLGRVFAVQGMIGNIDILFRIRAGNFQRLHGNVLQADFVGKELGSHDAHGFISGGGHFDVIVRIGTGLGGFQGPGQIGSGQLHRAGLPRFVRGELFDDLIGGVAVGYRYGGARYGEKAHGRGDVDLKRPRIRAPRRFLGGKKGFGHKKTSRISVVLQYMRGGFLRCLSGNRKRTGQSRFRHFLMI